MQNISILFFQELNLWVAQCLEFDINAQGKTLDEAKEAFFMTFFGQILIDLEDGIPALSTTPTAPQRFHDIFKTTAKRLAEDTMPPGVRLPPKISPATIPAHIDQRIAA